jgi:hypothetical protein
MLQPNQENVSMAELGWFFAGTSVGLFAGVLIMCLARMSQVASQVEQHQDYFRPQPPPEHPRLTIMRR